jgi:hypothetical protein
MGGQAFRKVLPGMVFVLVVAGILPVCAVAEPETYALLLCGDANKSDMPVRTPTERALDAVRMALERTGFQASVSAMRTALVDCWGVDYYNLHYARDMSADEFRAHANAFLALVDADDTLIFYYIGHGGIGAPYPNFKSGGLTYADLSEYVLISNAKRTIVIIDTCHSGSAVEDLSGTQDWWVLASVGKYEEGCSVNTPDWASGGTYFAREMSRAICSTPGVPGSGGGDSLDVDTNDDGSVSLREAFEYTKQATQEAFCGFRPPNGTPQMWPPSGDVDFTDAASAGGKGTQTETADGSYSGHVELVSVSPRGGSFADDYVIALTVTLRYTYSGPTSGWVSASLGCGGSHWLYAGMTSRPFTGYPTFSSGSGTATIRGEIPVSMFESSCQCHSRVYLSISIGYWDESGTRRQIESVDLRDISFRAR